MATRSYRSPVLTALAVALSMALSGCQGGNEPGLQPSSSGTPTQSATSTDTGTPTPTKPPLKTGIVKGKGGWSTYTNAELGFLFRFPTQIYDLYGSPCTKEDEENSTWSYRPAAGMVPATIVKDGDTFYLVPKYTWQLGDPQTTGGGSTKYHSCDKVTTTVRVIRISESPEPEYLLNSLPIKVTSADGRAAIQNFLGAEYFECPSVVVTDLSALNAAGWRAVSFRCDGVPDYFNAMFTTRFYPSLHLFVLFEQGQSYHVFVTSQKAVDEKVIKSFKPVS